MLTAHALELAPISCQLTKARLLPANYMYREESHSETMKVVIFAMVNLRMEGWSHSVLFLFYGSDE
jgi:hypothetical protein